ncbi:MAG TPA: hypothetical protein PLB88_06625 [Thermoanaerobaculaceae bacterium]|nr:hypothetical protein [Thermoanaerobaculaceae bacterium]HQU33975.1 hypothetical protein [Thermoanaerobaculaceae bacterium]
MIPRYLKPARWVGRRAVARAFGVLKSSIDRSAVGANVLSFVVAVLLAALALAACARASGAQETTTPDPGPRLVVFEDFTRFT